MGKSIRVAVLAACALLWGCGGSDSAPAVNDPSASAGFWQGTSTSGRAFFAALLASGQYWVIYSPVNEPDFIGGIIQGTASSTGGSFKSEDAVDMDFEQGAIAPATITASYTPRSTFNGIISDTLQSASFVAKFVFSASSSVSDIAGTYQGIGGTVATGDDTTLTLNSDGSITGFTSSGCTFTGTATARSDVGSAFDVQVTFGGGACELGSSTVNGIAIANSGGQLISMGVNDARTNGFLFSGTK
jgi:hypothetical protein